MYKDKNILALIPARGGSKRLPGKNIKDFCGKPLIAWTIKQAKESRYLDRVIVSTEDQKIAEISKKYGAEVPFVRPMELASDASSTIDVLLHAMNWMEKKEKFRFDILVLLQATSPLRTAQDIDNCIKLLTDNKDSENVFSAREKLQSPNGAVYVWWKDVLKAKKSVFLERSRIYVMPEARSIDIDDHLDFKTAETLLKNNTR